MARIDIEIEDYLDEVSTHDLISELSSRKNVKSEFRKIGIDILDEINSEDIIDYLKERFSEEKLIKMILNLREWHDKERIIAEIKEL